MSLALGSQTRNSLLTRVDPSRYPPTDEMFFVQNAGAEAAGTGLNKSNSIHKISLDQAAAVSTQFNASGSVNITNVNATPPVINSNGTSDELRFYHLRRRNCTDRISIIRRNKLPWPDPLHGRRSRR